MYYNNQRVKIENIEKLFSEYSLDIQDEVRSMVLDGLDLTEWVSVCKDNPYRLNQIRLAMKEGVDPRFFNISDGRVLYSLRKYLKSGFSGEELYRFVGCGFDSEQWEYILSWAEKGYLDKRLSLVRTPKNLWSLIDKGLQNNLPMWVFTTGRNYSVSEMNSLITIMSNGHDIDKFLIGSWRSDVIKVLGEFSRFSWYKKVVGAVYDFISLEFLLLIGELAKNKVIDADLLVAYKGSQGERGYYLYQTYHLSIILQAVQKGVDYTKLKDYNLRESDANVILADMIANRSIPMKGRL